MIDFEEAPMEIDDKNRKLISLMIFLIFPKTSIEHGELCHNVSHL